ncbi:MULTISPECIES: ATP-dependent zinc metalloprotease FtsH [Fusobacterium]|uniref:ATP-dependent zinc metalloprotease FtsH n=1 Tax=Fusobacterium TaxID=848 RepID=UPI0025BE0DDB|nr:ATP-dependent zinc metalloprotease FtsH [Fusobacterium sp.]MCI7224042.1 ATP-dependent zinc metalloprotease FtsH [Fusobacterium sp.]MDD7410726.1 ATP-dependent zinc metalloprotease FtsH [Fusobacteriaceae bacterium]MDY5713079.1 ATP-dependent zinc metalloprotease FtsH [Fusobacterium gastrosuis]
MNDNDLKDENLEQPIHNNSTDDSKNSNQSKDNDIVSEEKDNEVDRNNYDDIPEKKDNSEEVNSENNEKKEEKKDSNFENKKRNENNDDNKIIGKAFKIKFNLKGLLMLVFIISLIMYIPTIMSESKQAETKEVSYSKFIENLKAGEIKEIQERDGYVYGLKEISDETKTQTAVSKTSIRDVFSGSKQEISSNGYRARLITDRLGYDKELLQLISEKNVIIKSLAPEQAPILLSLLISWVPTLFIIGVLFFMINRMNKGGGGPQIFNMGKSKTKENGENISNVTFADVAGIEEAKHELEEVVEFLKEPEKFKKIGAKIPKGVLLLGNPGTGKTLLAKAVAGEAKVPFFSMSGSEFVEMFVGVGASRVRDLFNKARKNAPCIVFIDEIDAVGRKRGTGQGGGNDEREQTLNQLLVEMDGFGTEETIIVLAATNRPDVLDRALKRPGRFDRQVMVDMPDLKGRIAILKVHARNKKFSSDVNFEIIAKKTAGFAGADLANVLNEAAIIAARFGREEIIMADVEEASEKVVMGPEKRSKVVAEADKKIIAYHEAGHAVVNHIIGGETKVHKITMIPRGMAGGYTMPLPAEERMLNSKKYFLNQMVELYGGRAAEEVVFGDENITTGASNDIERATNIARFIVTRIGMTSKFGPILLDGTQDGDLFERKYYSEQTGKEIDDEIRKIITESYEKAKTILIENRNKLEAVTQRLLENETIMGDEFEAIMNDENI